LVNEILKFSISGGIAGRAYEVTINMTGTAGNTRSDVLTVNLLGGDCGCAPVPPYYPPGYSGATSGDGSIIINTRPRYFISLTPPVGAHVLDRWYNIATGAIADFVNFTLTAVDGTLVEIQTANNLFVSVDGVWQEPTTQFMASTDQVAFAQAPFSDSVVFMLWLSPPPDTPPAPGP
jgi:hypothetical protein